MKLRSMRPVLAVAIGGGLLFLLPSIASAAPPATKKVTVTRATEDPKKVQIGWLPVTGATRFNVSVFDGTEETVTSVPGTATTHSLMRSEPCVRLRVKISSRDSSGAGGTSGNVWLNSLAPGGVSALKAERVAGSTDIAVSWLPPAWLGHGAAGNYRVQLVRSGDNAVLTDTTVTETTARVPDVDPTKTYNVQVTAQNGFGSCATAKLKVGTNKPGPVAKLKAVRDAATPTKVSVTWDPPSYAGTGGITHYMIGYGPEKVTTWTKVSGTTTAATLNLDSVRNWVVQVQGVNEFGDSPAASVKLNITAAVGTPAVKPGITLTQIGAKIQVKLTSKIGAYKEYPKLVVRVRPTIDPEGFVDEHWGENGAQTLNFGDLPFGLYTVQISGANAAGEMEWARQTFQIGDGGLLKSSDWQLAVAASSPGGDLSVVSAKDRTGSDSALLGTVVIREGRGFGVWTRTGVSGGAVTGYLLEYDPKYVATGAPSMVLQTYVKGVRCGDPVAVTKLPAALSNSSHRVMLVAKGDSLYATVDDIVMVNIAKLTSAVSTAKCMTAPTGQQVGLRVWKRDGITTFTAAALY